MQRIESGRLRGRRWGSLPRGVNGLRPTSARVRGAIFDRLGGAVEGMRVLDLFAGSGALSFEALSRGASHATLVERDPRVVRFLRDAAQSLGLTSQVDIVRADALQWVATPPKQAPYDLVLIDPPFATPEVIEPLAHALVAGWLAPHAMVVCERERIRGKSLPVAWPRQLALRSSRAYGQAEVEFLELASQTESNMTVDLGISSRAAAIKPSATLAVSSRAQELRAQGKQVLNFAAGEPDFRPPEAVRKAVAEYSMNEPCRYAPVPGTPQLRDAVAHELGEVHGRTFSRSQILVSNGAKHSLSNLFLATLDLGDEVVIPAPYWVSYPDMVGLAEGKPVIAPTRSEDGWRLQPEVLEGLLSAKTRFVIINSPSNPTGAGYRADDLRALGEVLLRKAPQAWIVLDDIYRKLVYDGYTHVSAFRALEGLTEQIVVIDGVSKTYAMTGYRIGFMAAPAGVIAAASSIQSQMTSGASTPAQKAALVALTDPSVAGEVRAMHEAFTRRRSLILDGLSAAPGVKVGRPDGAFYVFADVSRHVGPSTRFADDVALATWLLEEKLVATVPGTPFGAPGYVRISYATDDATISEGCRRIVEAMTSLPTA